MIPIEIWKCLQVVAIWNLEVFGVLEFFWLVDFICISFCVMQFQTPFMFNPNNDFQNSAFECHYQNLKVGNQNFSLKVSMARVHGTNLKI
jgi:hypothetical protein